MCRVRYFDDRQMRDRAETRGWMSRWSSPPVYGWIPYAFLADPKVGERVGVFRAFSMAVKRWYILFPLILVSVGASWLVYTQIPATYAASAVSQVNPPPTPPDDSSSSSDDSADSDAPSSSGALSQSNGPFGDAGATAGKLAAVVTPPPNGGAAPPYTITVQPGTPLITVSASGSSATSVRGTVNAVTAKLTATLAQLQTQALVPTEQRMVLHTAVPAAVAPPVRTTGLRVFAVTLLFGLLLSVVVAAAVERAARRRRELLKDQEQYEYEYEADADDADAERADAERARPADAPDQMAELPTVGVASVIAEPALVEPGHAGLAHVEPAYAEAAPKRAFRSVPITALKAEVDADAPTQIATFHPVPPLGRNARVTGAAASSAAASSFGRDAHEAPTQIGAIAPICDDLPRVSRSVGGVTRELPPRPPRADLDEGPHRSVGGLNAAMPGGAVGPGPGRPGSAPDGGSLPGAHRCAPGTPSGSGPAAAGPPPLLARPEQAAPRQPDRPEPVQRPRQPRSEPPDSRRTQRPGRPGQPVRPGRPGSPELSGRSDQSVRPQRPVRPGLPGGLDQPAPRARPDRPGRPEQGVRPEFTRQARPGRPDRPDRAGPQERPDSPPSRPNEAATQSGPVPNRPQRARPAPAGPSPVPGSPSAERPPAAPARPELPASRPTNRFGGPDPESFASSALWDPVTPEEDGANHWLPAAQPPPPAAAVRDEPVRDERSRGEPGDRGSVEQTVAITAQDADHSQHVGHEREGATARPSSAGRSSTKPLAQRPTSPLWTSRSPAPPTTRRPPTPSRTELPTRPTPPSRTELPTRPTPPSRTELPTRPTPPSRTELPTRPTPPSRTELPTRPTPPSRPPPSRPSTATVRPLATTTITSAPPSRLARTGGQRGRAVPRDAANGLSDRGYTVRT